MSVEGDRPSAEDRIRGEAAEWFARIRAPDGARDVERLEAWLAADPAHRDAYERLSQRWDQTAFLANTPVGKGRDLARAAGWRGPSRRRAAAAAIAALALVGVVALQLNDRFQRPDPSTAVTRTNDQLAIRTIPLPDGSRVTLDTSATLRILYSASERRMRLENGRARFTVAHDPSRRFIVDAGDGSITAHGTIFDVTVVNAVVRVALLSGEVEVRKSRVRGASNAAPVVLRPGQQVTFAPARPISSISRADPEPWPNGRLVFDGTHLADAVAQFNRRNREQIRLEAEEHSDLRISGAYQANDPAGFAQAVAEAFGLATKAGPDQSILIIGRAR